MDPCHDVINIRRCGEVDALSILVDPRVVEALPGQNRFMQGAVHLLWPCRHGGTRVLCAALGDDPVKFVEVGVKVKHYAVVTTDSQSVTRSDGPLTATHSMMSTYFGRTTIVLKLPLTRAASTKGLQRYRGLEGDGLHGEAGTGGGGMSGKVADVGVGERFWARGRDMERLCLGGEQHGDDGDKLTRSS